MNTMTTEPDYFYYRGNQLINVLQGQGQSQPGQRFFQTATGLSAQINVGGNAGTWLIGADALGSILGGGDGTNSEEHRYAPYGGEKQQGATEGVMKLGYTRAYRDPLTGLYPLGNGYRCYLPELMCFNKADSLSPFGAGGVNTRSYCEGDPINNSDPSGHVGGRSLKRGFGEAIETVVEVLETIPLDIAFPEGALAIGVVDAAEAASGAIEGADDAVAEVAGSAADAAGAVAGNSSGIDEPTWADVVELMKKDGYKPTSPLRDAAPTTEPNIAASSTEPKRAKQTQQKVSMMNAYFKDPGTWDKHLERFVNPSVISDKAKKAFDYATYKTFLKKSEYLLRYNPARWSILDQLGAEHVQACVSDFEARHYGRPLKTIQDRIDVAHRLWDTEHDAAATLDHGREILGFSEERYEKWRTLWSRKSDVSWWLNE